MLNKHPILILLFVMLTSLAFAATTVTASHVIYDPDGVEQEVAIVGYTVHFDVTLDSDATNVDSVKIKSDNIIGETESFGLTLARRAQYAFAGDYLVPAGNVNAPLLGDIYQVFVYVDGAAVPLNTTNSYRLKVDNQIPLVTSSNSTWIESVPVGIDVFGIDDQMKFVFNRSWNPSTEDVVSLTLDLTSIGGPADLATTLVGDQFTATYTLLEGGIPGGYTPSVTIPMSMIDTHGNVSEVNASNVISGKSNEDPYPAYTSGPSFVGISDLQANGQFRFSPGSGMFGDWDTEPNTISAKIEIPGFGTVGHANKFVIRVENENTNMVEGFITFTAGDANVTVVGDMVTFVWDGRVDGSFLIDAVYGLTLVELSDVAGNATQLTPLPPILNPDITNGESELNALDFVVDNIAPLYENLNGTPSELRVFDSVSDSQRYTLNRHIDESNNNPGEQYTWGNNDVLVSTDEVYFAFSVKRDFLNDLYIERKEHVKYWVEVTSDTDSNFKKYFYPTSSILGEDAVVKSDVNFNETAAYSTVNSDGSFSWSPTTTDYVAGDYTVTAYIQDNAGNIRTSSKSVELVNDFAGYVPPIIPPDPTTPSDILAYDITSRHDGGANELEEITGSVPNFYVNSYFPGGDMYYNTGSNHIDIEVEISNLINVEEVMFIRNNNDLPTEFNTDLSNFVNNKVTLSVPVSAFDESATGTYTYGNAASDIVIKIMTRSLEGEPFTETVYASGNKSFKIVRPEQPVWPVITNDIVNVTPHCISPGNPSWAYDAVTNPANEDGMFHNGGDDKSFNEISFSIEEASVDYNWSLRIYDPDFEATKVKSYSGTALHNSGVLNETLNFANLADDLSNIVGALDTKLLNVELKVIPGSYADSGFIAPNDSYSYATTRVDNENPVILGTDGNNYIANPAGNTLFLANGIDSFNFDIETNEYLVTDNGAGNTWSAVVYDEDTLELVPGAVVNVTATPTNPTDYYVCPTSGNFGYKNFNITAEIINFADGILENVNYTLILRTPNDFGGNPGRYNNPPFPIDGDNWHADSSEAFVHFIVLREAPEVVSASSEFYYINNDSDMVLNKANTAGNFQFTVNINGYPGITPIEDLSRGVENYLFDVDFSNFVGATTNAPVVVDLGNGNWEITYTGSYTGIAAGINNGDVIEIPVDLSLQFAAGDVAVHEYDFTYQGVIYDNVAPTFTDSVVPNTVDENTVLTLSYELTDAIAGIQADQVTIVCSDNSLIADNTLATDLGAGIYQWLITIPNNYSTNTLTFDFVAQDMLDNESTTSHIVDITPMPTVSNVVVLNNSPEHQDIIKNGDSIDVSFDLTDSERIDNVTITLNDGQIFPVVGYNDGLNTLTINPFDATNYAQYDAVRASVEIEHTYNGLANSSSADSDPMLNTPFVDEEQVVISDLRFFENGVESVNNEFSAELGRNFYVEATFVAYENHFDANDLILNYTNTAFASAPTLVGVPVQSEVIAGYVKNTYTYRWVEADFDYNNFVDSGDPAYGYVELDFNLEITSDYDFYTQYNEPAVAVAIQDLPTVSNVNIYNVVNPDQHADQGNHIDIVENHNKVKVTFDLTDSNRITQAVITLNNGTIETVTTGLVDGLNTVIIDDFGVGNPEYATLLVQDITITHPYEYYETESSASSTNIDVPFIDNNQVVINDFRVFVNGVQTDNYFSIDSNQNVRFEADVIAYDGQLTTSNVVLTYNGFAGTTANYEGEVFESEDVTGYVKNLYTYSWDNSDLDFTNFSNQTAGYEVLPFVVEARSDFDFVATPYNQDVVALNIPEYTFNGISPSRYSGTDPEGWFAPEHDVRLTMNVNSVLADINPIAEFDNITNNFPDVNWVAGTVVTTSTTPIPGLTIYSHEVTWIQTPDVQACWNTYVDGQNIQVEVQYNDFFNVNPISILRNINIDLEVPTYANYTIVQADSNINDYATANAIPGINNLSNQVNSFNFDLSLNDPLDLSSYQFDGSLFVKRNVEDMNGVSVAEADVAMATVSPNWTVSLVGSEVLNPNDIALIWKLTPVDNTAVLNTDVVTIQFNQLEDLVGHKNYAGENYNSPSPSYSAVGPISTIEFIASQADVDGITAFQYDGMDRMNAATSPYISNGNSIGLILEVEPLATDNATVTTVEILADHYNVANQGWITLAYDVAQDLYYLDTDIVANTNLGWLPVEYRITYSTGEEREQTVANVYNLIDGTTTNLVDISVWSETLGQTGMYYVTPGDEATVRVVFNSDAPEAGTVMKPFVTLHDFSNILDMPNPYIVPQANISWEGANWVAEVTGVPVIANHNQTSQLVSVTATNITGQTTAVSTKTISYAGSGPIVPLIEHAELITNNAVNYLAVSDAQVVNPVVNVYINTQYQEYIDNVTIDAVAGLTFGAYTVLPTVEHNSKWMVTFPVTISDPAQFTEGQTVTLDITSYRDPFDNITTDVFEHEVSLDVEVDGNDFDVVLNNPGTQNPTMGNFEFSFDFTNFGETYNPAFVPALTDFVISSTQLVADMNPTAFNGNVASLTIDATDLTADAATMGNIDFTVTYTNIFGFTKSEDINILLDATAPVVVADGISFESVAGMTTYSWGDVIIYDQDFTSLKIELEDPMMFGTDGVGNIAANVDFALGSVTPFTPALNNLNAVFNGTEFEITFNGNYSGFDLAEGDYILTIDATDGLGNNYNDSQEFRYAHAPAGVSATTDPAITLNSGTDVELEFLVNDPDGVVNTVEFQVYLDANNDGDFADDLGNLVFQANDSVYPYGFNWDLSSPQYTSYQYSASYDINSDMDNLDADENIRNYIVRVLTTSSQMRSVSDTQFTYAVADVTAPEVSDVFAAGLANTQVIYDYNNLANNNIDFTALVNPWTDVDFVELTVNGDVIVAPNNWVYDATDIGQVVITAKAYDFVGNVSAEADFSTVLEIVNPSYDKFYNLALVDYTNFNSDNVIANGTVYSPNNDLTMNDVRIYTTYPNGLEGISEIQFFVNRIETATGNIMATLPVNNDATVNPQYGNNNIVSPANCYDATADVWNSWITVDASLYTNNNNYDGTDYSYEFYAVLIDSNTNIEVIPQVGIVSSDANFRVDYMKPELTVNNASVTHTSYSYYDGTTDRLVFDFVDYDGLNENDFVVDYNAVNVADNANITIDAIANTVSIPWTGLNMIELEGMVTYSVTVTDANGNVSEITPISVFVDNQAPQTTIANVAYLTDADNGGDAMNQLHAFNGNPIAVMAGGTENLTIQIDRTQILGLSSENTDTWANQTQPWYSNTNDDIYPPVALYRNIDGAGWNRIAFDHEVDANNMYQFDVTINNGAMVEFAVIAEDTRGNVEADVAPLDGVLTDAELSNAINLTVNVLYPTDITTTIVNHMADDVISGLELLTANVATPANVASVEFQYNDGMNWIALGTDVSMADVDYLFNIDNSVIPYTVVPGVHIEIIDSANVSTMVELDGANNNWSKTVTLARDTYTVNYFVDANNDGIIGPLEKVNFAITSETINADGFVYQFDTTTIVDGSYLFRAVPFDNLVATDDEAAAVEMNLIIDNTAPVFNFVALNTVMLDTYKVLDENVEFSLTYANANDVHTVQAWLVDVNNPVNTYGLVNDVYAAYDVRPTDFSVVLAGVPDGNYYLEVTVQDFVLNANNQTPVLGDDLHIDTIAPVITAVNNALNMSGIYTETHQFTVAYNDYLAQLVDANGAGLGVKELEATFTHNAIVDVVNAKVSDDGAQLVFDWTPSQAMMNEVLVNGQDNILVNLDVALTDLNDYVSADFNAGNFTLRSAEVGARIMVVSDFRNAVETYHQTSVTNNSEITDVIGGNNINMFAFLPEGNNVIVPNNVRFEYWDGTNWMQFAANAAWNPIANFAGTGTISGYSDYMEVNWNIANMDGDYTVRTVSTYSFGEIVNETNLHIWNSTIVPEIVVSTTDGTVTTDVNRGSEYIVSLGNIVSTHPEFFNQANYMYRFLDENDAVASPWNQLSGFTANDYNWTIGMDYLFAEKVQLAVQIENIFGNIADQVSFIANGGAYYTVDIVDSQAPMVTDLTVTQAGNPVAADATVAIANALDIAVTVDNAVLDLSSVVITLDGTEVNAVTYNTNNQVNPIVVNYTLDIASLMTGTYQIEVTTADFVGHTYTEAFAFSVDTDAPTGALVLTENVNSTITRGEYYTFNANAMDNVSTVMTINYFWSEANASVWTPIALDANNQWMIPQGWVIGASYDFKAVIGDEYNNVGETVVTYSVFDNITPLVANSMNTLVDDSIFNMNDEFTLTFDVDASNIINANIELQYADVLTGTWMSLGATPAVINNGVSEVTFNGLGILSGFYNFQAIVSDFAVPANQFIIDLAGMVYFDATAPEVFFTNIDDDSEFVLGNLVGINAGVNYTDGTNNIAPLDVTSVEFLINGVSQAVVEAAPYSFVWNTTLLASVGTYTIEAIVTDNDGFTNNVQQTVVVVTPDENDPYAVVTGFEFNNEAISSDKMYAMVNNWGNNVTSVVAQYTTNNVDWIDFAINTTNNNPYYEFDFNAEAISNASGIKVLVKMNNNEETSLVYPIDVAYNAGEFDLAPANGNIEIHENNLVIVDTNSMPYVIRVDENGYAGYETINANNEFNLVVNANNELPGYWLSGVANNNAWLKFVQLETQVGMASNNGITVNYNNPFWFVMLDNEMPLADHYAQLTDQVLVESNTAGNAIYTLPLTATMAAEGNVVALAWDALLADFVELTVEYNETDATMTFTAPVNTVVTVGQYIGFEMFVTEFAPVNNDVYMNAGALWTLPNVAMDFSVYHEETAMGYQLPAGFGLTNVSITLNDGVNNVNNIVLNNGVVSFDLVNMNAGENELMVNVEMNGFQANQTLTFNVDNSLPTIGFDSTVQLSAANRTLTATIVDAETGLVDYSLAITNNNPAVTAVINVPMNEITVTGNTFSYEMTVEELVTLVPQPMRSREIASLNVQWTAENNLNQVNVMAANVTANVVVNRPQITIHNDGFENGWWVNPAMSNQVLMTVVPANGRTIALEDIDVSILAVTDLNPAGILIQTSNPVPTGIANEYQFGFAQLQLPNSLGLKITVNAIDDIDVNNVAEQTFGLDYMDPVVTATAPTNLVVNYGTDAQVAFSFNDPQGHFTEVVNGVIIQHYSGASGINEDSVILTLDGLVKDAEVNNGSAVYAASDLTPGAHTAVVSVSDFVGNTASATVNFEVVGGPAPVVDFSPLANGSWWITTANNYEFDLTVDSGHNDTELQSVVANIIQLPNNDVIQGPFSVSLVNGVGTINFHGGIVTPGQNSIKVEVVAVNDWAVQTVSSQTYPIDNSRPELTIVNPMADYNAIIGNSVNVNIVAADNMSGLSMSSIKVTSLNSDFVAEAMDTETPESFNLVVTPDMAGTFVIEAQAKDIAGNVTTVTRNFNISAPAPIIVISDLEDSNGWVNTQNNNGIVFTVDGNGYTIDNSSIMASVIAIPSNEVIYEEYTVQAVNNEFVVNVHGGVIPTDANAIKVIVMASNVAGGNAIANHSYPIDSYSPTINFVTPITNATYTQTENMFVDVMVELSDIMPTVKSMATSGLDRLEMKVYDNTSMVVLDTVKTDVSNSYACRVPVNGMGQYLIEAVIYDKAGNRTTKMMNFTVEIDYSAMDLEFTAKPYMYPSPLTRGDAGTFVIPTTKEAQVTIEIFDFAGKLVREMNHNALGGNTNNMIQFDGRTNDGKRLPRGAYFARINIVDGAKELNKVVKIAIQ